MAEYISREDAVSALDVAERFLRKLAAADVVEVVRCKDCKHYDSHGYKICRLHSELPDQYSSGVNIYMERDDFCSYGERRNDV